MDHGITNNVSCTRAIFGVKLICSVMMNYGFCLPDNPCDYRILSLRAPPGSPLHQAKSYQLQMNPELAEEDDHYYVFNIFYPLLAPGLAMEHSIFSPALLNAISILAANDRELETLEITEQDIQIPNKYGNSRNLLTALSQVMIELITHIVKLKSSAQTQEPENLKQMNAKIYRDSQITLSENALIIAAWTLMRARQHDLNGNWQETKTLLTSHMARVPAGKFSKEIISRIEVRILERDSLLVNSGELFSFHELFGVLPREMQDPCKTCLGSIFAEAEKAIPVLRENSESALGFPVFLCLIVALHKEAAASPEKPQMPSRLKKWAGFLLEKYPPPPDDVAWMLEDEDDEHLASLFDDVVETMRNQNSSDFSKLVEYIGDEGGSWLSPNWLRWAWMVMEQETVQVPDDPLKMLVANGQGGSVMLSTVSYLYIPMDSE